jgi:glutamate N-acetyltransferase / amino-acid N-acetyltransferase
VSLAPLPIDLPPVAEVARMPAGFRAGSVAAGIKASGRLDLGVLATTAGPASAAAVFTTNLIAAAPVRLSRAHLARSSGRVAAVLSTSGCANAATSAEGERDQAALVAALAAALGIEPELTIAISTGLIGTRLPVDVLRRPIAALAAGGLSDSNEALAGLADQMRTTDSRAKLATASLDLPAADGAPQPVVVSGVAKGVGMIHPSMATMLGLLLTDAAAEPATLQALLLPIVERTWNQLTVDGDTSTNDTVVLLASGASGAAPIAGDDAGRALRRAVEAVARSLARQQAADGEGATTLITCQVSGARDDPQARALARSVVASSLVKAAVHGRDPNWGRIAAAAGNARIDGRPAELAEPKLRIAICGVDVFAGRPLAFDRAGLARRMDAAEVLVRLDLGVGDGSGEAFGCDLSEAYVVENSAYSS